MNIFLIFHVIYQYSDKIAIFFHSVIIFSINLQKISQYYYSKYDSLFTDYYVKSSMINTPTKDITNMFVSKIEIIKLKIFENEYVLKNFAKLIYVILNAIY